jgi:HEAT repeat protein
MRPITLTVALATVLTASVARAQQPEFINAQLTTDTAPKALAVEIATLKHANTPTWIAYSVPVAETFSNGWNSDQIRYLEGSHPGSGDQDHSGSTSYDHAIVLLRVDGAEVQKIDVESPNRKLDAGNLRVVWLPNTAPGDSITTLASLATQSSAPHLRDAAVFAISLHQSTAATAALVSLTAPANDLELREKASFWLANQRGHDGFVAIQRLAREDADPAFREKLTFDLTLTKDPAAIPELIRMAHEDAAPNVRKQAQFWMAQKGGKLVAANLHNLAENDPEASLRKSAVFAISQLPHEEATPQLIRLAQTGKDPAVRKQAVFWLGQSSDPRALDYLTQLLKQ